MATRCQSAMTGAQNYPYSSIGRALVDDGVIAEDELSLPALMEYFGQQPEGPRQLLASQ